jgi:hypothetical protein
MSFRERLAEMTGMFNRKKPEYKGGQNPDNITLPEGAVKAQLKTDMETEYRKRLLKLEKKAAETHGPEWQEAMEDYLLDLYKFHIRLNLLRGGSIDRQMLAENLRANHPTNMASFNNYWFTEAFNSVSADINRKLQD